MKHSNKNDGKAALKAEKSSRVSMSPLKKKLLRAGIELGVSILGVLLIPVCRRAFYGFVGTSSELDGVIAVATDNFELYFKISLALCNVLLILTLLSALTYLFQHKVGAFQRMTVSASPLVCSALLIAVSLFYAYLTSGGGIGIAGYLALLGLGEAMLFRLPCAVYVLLRKTEEKTTKSK